MLIMKILVEFFVHLLSKSFIQYTFIHIYNVTCMCRSGEYKEMTHVTYMKKEVTHREKEEVL